MQPISLENFVEGFISTTVTNQQPATSLNAKPENSGGISGSSQAIIQTKQRGCCFCRTIANHKQLNTRSIKKL